MPKTPCALVKALEWIEIHVLQHVQAFLEDYLAQESDNSQIHLKNYPEDCCEKWQETEP